MQSLKNIIGIIIIDKDENRILTNYNEHSSLNDFRSQREFEKMSAKVLNNSVLNERDVFTIQNKLILAKTYADFYLIVVSEDQENEMLLSQLIEILDASFEHFFGKDSSLKFLYSHFEELTLILNEAFSNGLIMTLNSEDLIARVSLSKFAKSKPRQPSGRTGVMGFLGL